MHQEGGHLAPQGADGVKASQLLRVELREASRGGVASLHAVSYPQLCQHIQDALGGHWVEAEFLGIPGRGRRAIEQGLQQMAPIGGYHGCGTCPSLDGSLARASANPKIIRSGGFHLSVPHNLNNSSPQLLLS